MSAVARKKRSSGEHSAVKAFRAKMDSIREGTLPLVQQLNARIQHAASLRAVPPCEDEEPLKTPEPEPRP